MRLVGLGVFLLAWGGLDTPASAAPRAGTEAPALQLRDLAGTEVDPRTLSGRVRVLVFGELYHHGTRQACARIEEVLAMPRLAGERITPVLIIAQDLPAGELNQQAQSLDFVGLVLHDRERKAFGAYRIAVMPTVVVIDARDEVVHSMPGLTARFSDILGDALLVASGRLSRERFEQTLRPETVAISEEQARADRTAQLAHQLSRRGLDEMAQEKYDEALSLWPGHAEARLGLGRLLLRQGRIAHAERQFQALLEHHPGSTEAALGVAFVKTLRGGDELAEAEQAVRGVLGDDARHARAHYLLGLINQQRGREAEAAESYRRAAEILMQGHPAHGEQMP